MPALLEKLAAQSDVLTFDWENISGRALAPLEKLTPIRPPRAALEVSQDRLAREGAVQAPENSGRRACRGRQRASDLERAGSKLGRPGHSQDPAPGL